MNINVYNLHEDQWEGKSDYIGRPGVLGNPFAIGRDGNREAVVEKYRTYLNGIVQAGLRGEFSAVVVTSTLTKEVESALRTGELSSPALRACVWHSVMELLRRARAGERLNLLCYCKPLDCHGDVMKRCLEWLNERLKPETLKR